MANERIVIHVGPSTAALARKLADERELSLSVIFSLGLRGTLYQPETAVSRAASAILSVSAGPAGDDKSDAVDAPSPAQQRRGWRELEAAMERMYKQPYYRYMLIGQTHPGFLDELGALLQKRVDYAARNPDCGADTDMLATQAKLLPVAISKARAAITRIDSGRKYALEVPPNED